MSTQLKQLINTARDKFAALNDFHDPEAIHQFRVSLRKIDTYLRAIHSNQHDLSVCKQQVKKLFKLSNEIRDYDVSIEWLAGLTRAITDHHQGIEHLFERLSKERQYLADINRPKIIGVWAKVQEELIAVDNQHRELKTDDLQRALNKYARAYLDAFNQLDRDNQNIHKARIKTKRLRYFLTLFQEPLNVQDTLINQLKQQQQALGDIHDRHQFCVLASQRVKTYLPAHADEDVDVQLRLSGDLIWISQKAHAEAETATDQFLESVKDNSMRAALASLVTSNST